MKKLPRLASIDQLPEWVFPLLFFAYALIVGLLIQLVLLPYVFPEWHTGEGLLDGNDSISFHNIAEYLSQRIESEGWQAWCLAPYGQPVSGIASIFYVLIAPHPWAVLPLNAALHALAAWLLFKVMRFHLEKRSYALLATLPFLLFPSSLLWVAQMHNDNYSVTGSILVMYAWICFARQESWQNPKRILGGIFAMIGGGFLIWMVRNYMIDLFTAVGGALLFSLILLFLFRLVRSRWTWKKTVTAIVVTSLTFILVTSLENIKITGKGMAVIPGFWMTYQAQDYSSGENPPVGQGNEPETETVGNIPNIKRWEYTKWLPDWLDTQMKSLSTRRTKAIRNWTEEKYGVKGSNIDTDVTFHSAMDIVKYMPRAAEIGFLAPFPEEWFGQGSKAPNTMMRRVSGLEMVFIYLSWPGLLFALWMWRKRPELWVMLFFCTVMLLIFVLATPNVGSLYRFRYPYIMPMVGLGVAGWIVMIKNTRFLHKVLKFRPRASK